MQSDATVKYGSEFCSVYHDDTRSSVCAMTRWPTGITRGSAAACLLGLRDRIPPEAWMSVCCVVCFQVEIFATGFTRLSVIFEP
jgi:hypothetical protein